jgi:AcrR family transcriptional regulator
VTEPALEGGDGAPPRTRRLTAEARRKSILKAARGAFSETGDMNGTTIKAIAERGGISEGVIYRHFDSKDQLFYEAVVEPLREAVDELVAASEVVDRDEPLTPERQLETLQGLYRQLISTLEEVLPLLGLVLFGDPQVAQRFYRESFAVAMDRLAEAWRAVESHHDQRFDRDRAVILISEGTMRGFFPAIQPDRRRP